ncbi:hypothetical protein B0T36_19910 [Nocardia donostiensis]|nr:hypothetical protein B0T36_19910 [Nocardia donostiensis]
MRVHQHGASLRRHAGASSNSTNVLDEPADHAIGRSRGGLTTKAHLVVDGNGQGLSPLLTPGQARDSPTLPQVLDGIVVPRLAHPSYAEPHWPPMPLVCCSVSRRARYRDTVMTLVFITVKVGSHAEFEGVTAAKPFNDRRKTTRACYGCLDARRELDVEVQQ